MVFKLFFYLCFGKDDRYLCPFRNAVRSHYPDRTFIMECFFNGNIVNFCFSIVLLTLIRVHEHRCPPVHEHTHTRWVHDGCILHDGRVHDGCILHDGCTMGAFYTMGTRWMHYARWVHDGCILDIFWRWVHDGYTMGAFCTMGARWVHSARWVHDGCILHDGCTMGAFCTMDGYTMDAFCTMGARWVHSTRWVHDGCIMHDG